MPYLMDSIVETSDTLAASPRHVRQHPVTAIFPTLASQLKGTPRFLLDEASINTAVEITLGRPKLILDALAHARAPYPTMWVEWPESGRARLREEFEGLITSERPLPNRVGFLLECIDETGRRGTATWVWTSSGKVQTTPNVGLVSPYFDLDQQFDQSRERVEGFLRGNLSEIWRGNKVQEEALLSIWRTAHHAPSEWGKKYLQWIGQTYGIKEVEARLPWIFSDVYGEYIMIWAIILMLTSSRRIVDYLPVDRSKINKIRHNHKKTLLLDHTEVVLHLGQEQKVGQRQQPLGYTRKSPRIHMVSSFLNHRGDKHWIVQPFLRGQGEMIHRNVKVKGAL